MQKMNWWQRGIIYEVYPRSFQDSSGDGVGDLAGILSRLDYLVTLGINAVWISPIYPSPMADFGYDVADYCAIDPLFGTMQDFDRLLEQIHACGLKLILDFVPNHTSDKHPWFLESRSSRDNPKRDWYLWRDQPNNWMSNFGGSGWQFDEDSGQYYYHSFLKEQPDLNWRNIGVRRAMYDVLRFWLAKGVDGFRVDVMWLMIKDDEFRDNPPNPEYQPGGSSSHRFLPVYNSNRPEVHVVVEELRAVIDDYPERVLIGEIYLPIQQLMTYYGTGLKGANLPFNFQLLQCPWNAESIAQRLAEYEKALPVGAWPNWVLGNHDNARIASRIGRAQARIAAILLLTLPGTLTMYYGEETGMTDVVIPPGLIQDPAEKNEPGIGMGRDPERTPMQWDSSPGAGFTTGSPWLPLSPTFATVNVAAQLEAPDSMLHLYRRLIALRNKEPALVDGAMDNIFAMQGLLTYHRKSEGAHFLVLLNLSDQAIQTTQPGGEIVVSTCTDRTGKLEAGAAKLDANEGIVLRLDSKVDHSQ